MTITDTNPGPAIWQPLRRKEPLYRQAMNIIEAAIREGRYTRGALLPSEAELGASLGISRATVRQALAGLRALGMVEVHNGKGAFVAADWDAPRCPACGQPKASNPDAPADTLETDLRWVLAGLPDNQTQIWTQRLLDLLAADNPGVYRTWTAQQLAATLMNRHDLASIRIARRVGGVHAVHHGYRIADLARVVARPSSAGS